MNLKGPGRPPRFRGLWSVKESPIRSIWTASGFHFMYQKSTSLWSHRFGCGRQKLCGEFLKHVVLNHTQSTGRSLVKGIPARVLFVMYHTIMRRRMGGKAP